MRSRIASLALLLACSVAAAKEPTQISGRLLGANGKPMRRAQVHLAATSHGEPIASVEAGKDGTFKLSTEKTGLVFLQMTGVDHMMQEVPILIERPEEIRLDGRLEANHLLDTVEQVSVIGEFNRYAFTNGVKLQRDQSGIWSAEIQTDLKSFPYQLLGIVADRSVNGTESESFIYDNGGDYRSVATPKNGKVRIVFDPKKMPRSTDPASLAFRDPRSTAAQLSTICAAALARQQKLQQDAAAFVAHGGMMLDFRPDLSKEKAELESAIAAERNPILRQALLISYLDLHTRQDSAVASRALVEIPPASPLWALSPNALYTGLSFRPVEERGDKGVAPYIKRVIDANPSDDVKAMALITEMMRARQEGREQEVQGLYTKMVTDLPTHRYTTMARAQFSPDAAIKTGKSLPQFSLASLDQPGVTYTNESFKGKVYMIDFWATWCGPCVGEMSALHHAYERYHGRNFEILSLSFDASPDDVAKFRSRKWKMPWKHAFVEGRYDSDIAKRFEVLGIPRPILVDGNGTILAVDSELRGENLEKTLARVLGPAN